MNRSDWFALKSFALILGAAFVVCWSRTALAAANGTWKITASDQLWSGTGNWSGGIVADGLDSTANFNSMDITDDMLVRVDTGRMIGNLVFGDIATGTAAGWALDNNGNAANILTLAGNTPTITGAGGILTINPSAANTFAGFLEGSINLVKVGGQALTLTSPNTISGSVAVLGGGLKLADGGTLTTTNWIVLTGMTPRPITGGVLRVR